MDDVVDEQNESAAAAAVAAVSSPGPFYRVVTPRSVLRTPRPHTHQLNSEMYTRYRTTTSSTTPFCTNAGGSKAAAAAAGSASSSSFPASSSASTFHFRWLVVVGLALEGWSLLSRDWVLTRSIAALAAVAVLGAAATVGLVALTNWYLFTREASYASRRQETQTQTQQQQHQQQQHQKLSQQKSISRRRRRSLRTGGGDDSLTAILPPWLIGRCRKYEETYARCDLAIREVLISSLHFVVAVVLITGGIILVVVIAAFFTVNIAQESTGAVAAAHRWSVIERDRSLQEGALQQAVEAGTAAWEDAVEKHWPAALAWAQAHVEDVFPGANVTELWISAQHIYAQVREALGRVVNLSIYI